MHFTSLALLSGFVAVASAHFQLQFPAPRGVFVMNNEPTFCDGYTHSVSNRTLFPINGGFISLNSEHPSWSLGVQLSTLSDPQTFGNFSEVVPFVEVTGEGLYCFPVDFGASGLSGLTDGANVTIQLIFNGGDDQLYQCADLTLSSTVTISESSITCTNATGDTAVTQTGSSSASSTSTTGAPSASSSSSASANTVVGFSGLLGLIGVVLSAL